MLAASRSRPYGMVSALALRKGIGSMSPSEMSLRPLRYMFHTPGVVQQNHTLFAYLVWASVVATIGARPQLAYMRLGEHVERP